MRLNCQTTLSTHRPLPHRPLCPCRMRAARRGGEPCSPTPITTPSSPSTRSCSPWWWRRSPGSAGNCHRRLSRVRRTLLISNAVALLLLLAASGTAVAEAAAAPGAVLAQAVLAQAQSVEQVLGNIRTWVVGILALLATVFLTIGGVRYILGSGDPGEIEKAKSAFRSACVGYALAVLAPLVVEILRGIVEA